MPGETMACSGREVFLQAVSCAPETVARLDRYAELLQRWNGAINLVSRATVESLWTRHFLDSAQLLDLVHGRAGRWVDLGSGGGFPGMVVAMMSMERGAAFSVTLVEADARKAEFLRAVSRETSTPVTVLAERIESLPPLKADILSARALAPLPRLLAFAERHLAPNGVALFPKGRNAQEELAAALAEWTFTHQTVPSRVDPESSTFIIGDPHRA